MLNLPDAILPVMAIFAPLFSQPSYQKVLHLAVGSLISRGNKTISNCLRCLGLKHDSTYSKYYDIFRRAQWSSLAASKALFLHLVKVFISNTPIEVVIDTTLERRRGPYIYGLGKHRDAVRSTREKKVFSIGHNWLVAALLIRFPGTKTKWALPFISILLKPKQPLRANKNPKAYHRHKKMTRWAAQLILLLRRWLGKGPRVVVIADSAFSCRLICRASRLADITFCSQIRLDARLYNFPDPKPYRLGRPRLVGERLRNMDSLTMDPDTKWERAEVEWYGGKVEEVDYITGKALWYGYGETPEPITWVVTRNETTGECLGLMFTELEASAKEVIEHFVSRWSIETTFQEVREHLNYETLRTWANKGIERASPSVMALYSIVVLIAQQGKNEPAVRPYQTAWYPKDHLTFSDLYAYVKMLIINEQLFPGRQDKATLRKAEVEDFLYRMVVG